MLTEPVFVDAILILQQLLSAGLVETCGRNNKGEQLYQLTALGGESKARALAQFN